MYVNIYVKIHMNYDTHKYVKFVLLLYVCKCVRMCVYRVQLANSIYTLIRFCAYTYLSLINETVICKFLRIFRVTNDKVC